MQVTKHFSFHFRCSAANQETFFQCTPLNFLCIFSVSLEHPLGHEINLAGCQAVGNAWGHRKVIILCWHFKQESLCPGQHSIFFQHCSFKFKQPLPGFGKACVSLRKFRFYLSLFCLGNIKTTHNENGRIWSFTVSQRGKFTVPHPQEPPALAHVVWVSAAPWLCWMWQCLTCRYHQSSQNKSQRQAQGHESFSYLEKYFPVSIKCYCYQQSAYISVYWCFISRFPLIWNTSGFII